jgi:mitochondrial import inner membrane translocase subunit TIM50
MLARALLPLSRPRNLAPAITIAVCHPPRRFYAREKKPKTKNENKLSTPIPRSQWETLAASKDPTTGNTLAQNRPPHNEEYTETQPEFETPKKPSEVLPPYLEESSFENGSQRKDQTNNITPEAARFEEELSNGNKGEQQPLPDLTRGIPSTLDAELEQARSEKEQPPASLNITEDPAEPIPSGGGRGGDGLPKNAYISSNERKKNALIKYTYLAVAGALVGWTVYLGRNWESEEEEKKHADAPSGWGLGRFYDRVRARMASTLDYYNAPAFPKLLPDEEADPNLRAPFTLVLSLEDLLVHQEWTRESGWRIAKRPGVDYFIRYLSQYYELVLFTSQPSFIGDSILRKLDPYRIIRWPLFREATLYKKGDYVKVSINGSVLFATPDMLSRTSLT